MDIQDIIFNPDVTYTVKQAVLALMEAEHISDPYTRVLTPTMSNDDVNGGQHSSHGGSDFTYEDLTVDVINDASALGFYEYFSGQ